MTAMDIPLIDISPFLVGSEQAKQDAVKDITHLLEQGKLQHVIGPRFPLESTVKAHQAVEGGAVGNVVLDVGNERQP